MAGELDEFATELAVLRYEHAPLPENPTLPGDEATPGAGTSGEGGPNTAVIVILVAVAVAVAIVAARALM